MNSTFLRVLATLMVIAAVVTGYIGYRLSQKKPSDNLAVVVPTYTQVIAKNTLPAEHVLVVEDLETATTPNADKRAFSDPQALVGKVTNAPIIKGAPFNASYFPAVSALGQALAPNERAVAIKVNEVVGVGGFIKPGDHVDVLLYLRSERETGDISSAQVVLNNVKVLAYGTLTGETESSQADASTPAAPAKLGANSRAEKNGKDSRSAILAVHANDIAKLMLADSTGSLRLALRGEASPGGNDTVANSQFIRLGEVSQQATSTHTALPLPAAAQVIVSKHPTAPPPKGERVIVHMGDKTEVINVAR